MNDLFAANLAREIIERVSEQRNDPTEFVQDEIERILLKSFTSVRLDELRKMAKRECMWCESPIELKVSTATRRSGDGFWIHHKQNSLGDHDYEGCDCGMIHERIFELDKES